MKQLKDNFYIVSVVALGTLAFFLLIFSAYQGDMKNREKDEAYTKEKSLNEKLSQEIAGKTEENSRLFGENWDLKNSIMMMTEDTQRLEDVNEALKESVDKLKKDTDKYLNGKTYIQQNVLDIVATGYTQSEEEGTANGITYTETKVTEGRTVAVDPNVIPLGSLLYVESNSPYVGGFYIAEDIGGAIKGNRIDVYMESKNQAFLFGKQNVTVTVLKEVK
jgi:3D (Asp-Asp-Asp) domain-containing protein/molybdopterin converting factor small subunit